MIICPIFTPICQKIILFRIKRLALEENLKKPIMIKTFFTLDYFFTTILPDVNTQLLYYSYRKAFIIQKDSAKLFKRLQKTKNPSLPNDVQNWDRVIRDIDIMLIEIEDLKYLK
tara:strand:- start:81 stop:422 length:342 start_codon:yes stop_codon:yes gene_type:complete